MWQKLIRKTHRNQHPQHTLIGLFEILVSIILLSDKVFFFYPPYMAKFLNDDAIGTLGVVLGICMIVWSIRDTDSVRTNFWLLVLSCAFWAFQFTATLIHALVASSAYLAVAGTLEVAMFCFTISIIGKATKG